MVAWARATSRASPRGKPVVVVVDDALLTPLNRGPMTGAPRAAGDPALWMTGAVYDAEGRLVPESQRDRLKDDPGAPVACDPTWVPVPEGGRRLRGTWMYVGHWAHHFGHFLVETMPNLWPEPSSLRLAGLIAHQSLRGGRPRPPGVGHALHDPHLPDWQRELLGLAGYGDLRVRIMRGKPVRVDSLVVPSRPVTGKNYAHPEAVAVWRRLAASVAGAEEDAPRKVFLSRGEFNNRHRGVARHDRSSPEWDALLDRTFRDAGFAVVTPERLSIAEQVRVVAGAEIVAGSAGSALHLSAVARPGSRILEIGDARSPRRRLPTQRLIDAAAGHLTAFVRYQDLAALEEILSSTDGAADGGCLGEADHSTTARGGG